MQADAPPFAADKPDNIGVAAARRHEINDGDYAIGGLETGLENQRVLAVGSRPAGIRVGHVNDPAAVPSSAAKQAPESKRGQHSQSIEPDRETSAAVSQSPISA